MILTFALYVHLRIIGFYVVDDVNNAINSIATLQDQIKVLQGMATNAQTSAESLKQIQMLTEKLSQGIDEQARTLNGSRSNQSSLQEIQKRGLDGLSQTDDGKTFDSQVHAANQADLNDLSVIDSQLKNSKSGFTPRLGVQVDEKQAEVMVRMSTQLNELTREIRQIRQNQEGMSVEKRSKMADEMVGAMGKSIGARP